MDEEGLSEIRRPGEMQRVFPPPARPQEACWAPRPGPLSSEAPYGFGDPRGIGGREEGEIRGEAEGGDHPGPGDQGRSRGLFHHPLSPRRPVGLPGMDLSFWDPLWQSGFQGHRREGGGRRRRDANEKGPTGIAGSGWGGNTPSVSPTHLGPVSLLGS